jgi:hypothetical protein
VPLSYTPASTTDRAFSCSVLRRLSGSTAAVSVPLLRLRGTHTREAVLTLVTVFWLPTAAETAELHVLFSWMSGKTKGAGRMEAASMARFGAAARRLDAEKTAQGKEVEDLEMPDQDELANDRSRPPKGILFPLVCYAIA